MKSLEDRLWEVHVCLTKDPLWYKSRTFKGVLWFLLLGCLYYFVWKWVGFLFLAIAIFGLLLIVFDEIGRRNTLDWLIFIDPVLNFRRLVLTGKKLKDGRPPEKLIQLMEQEKRPTEEDIKKAYET